MTTGEAPRAARITALRRFAMSITILTILGHSWLGFEESYAAPVLAIITAYVVELILETLDSTMRRRPLRYMGSPHEFVDFMLPAHITGLACAMLLYANDRLAPVAFAAGFGVASKYIFRVRISGSIRHVLNPSNTGIVATLLLFPWVGIASPYQFTEHVRGAISWIIPLALLASGTLLNAKLTRKMPLISAWLIGFVAQAALRSTLLDGVFVATLLPLTGVAFILFTNYMITDPGSTPTAPGRQVAFGAATAAVYGTLVTLHIAFGLFFALSIVCVGRGLALASWNAVARLRADRTVTEGVPVVLTPARPPRTPVGAAERSVSAT